MSRFECIAIYSQIIIFTSLSEKWEQGGVDKGFE